MRMRKRKWVKDYLLEDNPYLLKDCLNFDNLNLEIGMGMGDFLSESARLNPEEIFIGLERDETCVAKSLKKINSLALKNAYVIHEDADALKELFKAGSIKRIYLQFSDPWPKKRHEKRRLTSAKYLDLYSYLLKAEGELYFKSDNQAFFEYSMVQLCSEYELLEMSVDRHREENGDVCTEYEKKFRAKGQPIYYGLFKKKREA